MVRSSVVVRLVVASALGGCGDNLPPDAIQADILAQLSVQVVGTLHPDHDRGLALAALDENTIAVARAISAGDAFCPDCIGRDPALCPAICRRTRIAVEIHHSSGAPDSAVTIVQVFPRSVVHDVDGIDIVSLGNRRVGVGWLDCDNAACQGVFARQSCDARYATLDLNTLQIGPIATLYEERYGELQLASDPSTRRVLAMTTKQSSTGVGLRAAIFDDTGNTLAMPWTPLGGIATRAASATATPGGFTIVADDRNPGETTAELPCQESCDCQSGGAVDLATGGLYAYHLDGGTVWTEQIAPGKGHDGEYGAREATTTIRAGDRLIVAAGQSIDRAAELFDTADGKWRRRLDSRAPAPLWIGALGDAQRLAWLGSESSGAPATVRRLVAGVIDGATSARGELEPAVDSHVFDVSPLATATGVTQTYLLRGVFAGSGEWDRYELLEVRAQW
jgi:hypothetical protein